MGGAAERGDKAALIDGATGAVTTYAELAGRVTRSAAGLAEHGIGKGDAVGLLGPNSADWVVAFQAASVLGAIVTSVNPLLTQDEVGKQLATADAKAVIAAGALRGAVAGFDTVFELESLPEADGGVGDPGVDPEGDLAVLPFSSGTTGLSKGVMLTHRNLVANMEQIRSIHRIGADDVLIGVLPFFHIYGQTVVVNLGLSQGATVVTMPRFDMGQFLDLLERHRVTRAHIAPPVVLGLAKAPGVEGRDLALRVVISGAAPMDADTANRAGERLGAPVRQGYGMTEASPVTHFADDDRWRTRTRARSGGSSATPRAGSSTPRRARTATATARSGSAGPRSCAATWATRRRPRRADRGRLAAHRRRRAARGGRGLADRRPRQGADQVQGLPGAAGRARGAADQPPGVADAAVIPIPDEAGGEAPMACVVPAGDDLDTEALMAWVAERVAPYKRIRAVEIVDEIPKSASGKILRRLLRDRARG